ncbi:tRNA dihydrouridine synthase DusB [Thioalkalivibrio paradoxus]|uniref:tRNA-dihydrouridine synthase n=1 Tax=Thioalkalivibrio paradoxus ARh 1 TaxID=713585 RepID=W0DLE8_9GAMM|nr:tRNA dihydrouridine synthase DusB [Thioalkalivibrio paradoxus]AHE99424.1 tRNA-dihydrouridine synthase B [Thioalkalivibrio paradoxus ARh 1]
MIPNSDLRLGTHRFAGPVVFLAPMAGVSDRPFRQLCRRLGASAAVSEMVTSDTRLWDTAKTRHRLDHQGEPAPRIVQLLGNDPDGLAQAARENVARGADIIDLNLGCPAKKVCRKAAGSALLADEALVERLLHALTAAVSVPVTLKMRLGIDRDHLNAAHIARIAERAGVAMLTVHGRTRACGYRGDVDYPAIARVVDAVAIPVLANGDITTAQRARAVLEQTGAAGVMIGRGAQGRPWLPGQIRAALNGQPTAPPPRRAALGELIEEHVAALHRLYGPNQGVRIARKHIGWYLQHNRAEIDRRPLLALTDAGAQLAAIRSLFDRPAGTRTVPPAPGDDRLSVRTGD